jgi:hypothetical protein
MWFLGGLPLKYMYRYLSDDGPPTGRLTGIAGGTPATRWPKGRMTTSGIVGWLPAMHNQQINFNIFNLSLT